MGLNAYSTTPGSNTTISGINLAEGCNASGINDAIRQIMADIAASGLSNALYGLVLSAAGATATFGIAAGAASGMSLGSAYTKTTGAWAVGTGNGSLDTGAIAINTWYHVYLIQRGDTAVVDVLISLSATAPTMPTNYTLSRRIGAMKTDGSSQWIKFVQLGDEFLWDAAVFDANDAALSSTETLYTLSVPTGLKVIARVRGLMQNAAAGSKVLVHSPDVADVAPANGNCTAIAQVGGVNVAYTVDVRTNTSAQVKGVATAVSTVLQIYTYGWLDNRGRA